MKLVVVGGGSTYTPERVDGLARLGDAIVSELVAHPLVGQYHLVGQLADRLVAENAEFLAWAVAQ